MKNMKGHTKKVVVFGYFGFVTDKRDGQTIKTRSIYELLKTKKKLKVEYVDSQEIRYKKYLVFSLLRKLIECDFLVIIPAHNNLKKVFPICYCLSKIFGFKIIHIGVGGWLDKYLEKLPSAYTKMLKNISVNLLQTQITVDNLIDDLGFENVEVIPNFRNTVVNSFDIRSMGNCLELVFMARMNMKKGLDTMEQLAFKLRETGFDKKISITFYGPFDSEIDRLFMEEHLVQPFSNVNYKGSLSPNDIHITLRNYDVMIFPTHYFTEGFPGTVLDAFQAGLPVIATAWQHSKQFIKDGVDGYLVDFEKPMPALYERIIELYNAPDNLLRMKKAAYEESLNYTPRAAWNILSKYF